MHWPISQGVKQSEYEICSVNRIWHEKHFLEKSYTKCGRETIPRQSSKNENSAYPWIEDNLRFYKVCFYCMASWGLTNY